MYPLRLVFAGVLLGFLALPAATGEKSESWVEVRSPNFRVVSNGGEKKAEQVAVQFETIRAVFRQAMPFAAHPSPLITVLAAKDEKSLSQLLPEYWATKGHVHPAGIFFGNFNKYFVALRTDVTGPNTYETIYHEYYHSLTLPYFPDLPLWLAEGLAEFFGHTDVQGKQAILGDVNPHQLGLLRQQQQLLPLNVLFQVNGSSPYYNEQDKTTIFYAESWALTHYLMVGDHATHRKPLADYLRELGNGVPQDQAAREAFGDLNQLLNQLEDYVSRFSLQGLGMATPEIGEKNFPARQLSAAESAALRADFFVCRQRLEDAQPLLDEALRLDPKVALAHESMGFLEFLKGDREEAARRFGEAISLDSQSYLVYYYRAMLSTEGGHVLDTDDTSQTESDLRHAIALNPNFASAYSILAIFEAGDREKWPEALALAKKAVALEPGNSDLQVNLGGVLLHMNRLDEAQEAARIAQLGARTPVQRDHADDFLASLEQERRILAGSPNPGETTSEAEENHPTKDESPAATETNPPNMLPRESESRDSARAGSAEGNITAVTCSAIRMKMQMSLTLDVHGQPLRLGATNVTQIQFLSSDWTPPDRFEPCHDLQGLRARVTFTPGTDTKSGAEIQSIEIRAP